MKYKVDFVKSAENDLFDIYTYVLINDSEASAESLYFKLFDKCKILQDYPQRGHIPPELLLIGIDSFLEITWKSFRIIYQIRNKVVTIHCILDGRRDIQKILQERLLLN